MTAGGRQQVLFVPTSTGDALSQLFQLCGSRQLIIQTTTILFFLFVRKRKHKIKEGHGRLTNDDIHEEGAQRKALSGYIYPFFKKKKKKKGWYF